MCSAGIVQVCAFVFAGVQQSESAVQRERAHVQRTHRVLLVHAGHGAGKREECHHLPSQPFG